MISKRLSEKLMSSSLNSASMFSASLTLSSKRAVAVHQTERMKPNVTANRLDGLPRDSKVRCANDGTWRDASKVENTMIDSIPPFLDDLERGLLPVDDDRKGRTDQLSLVVFHHERQA